MQQPKLGIRPIAEISSIWFSVAMLLVLSAAALASQSLDVTPEQLVDRIIQYEVREGGTGSPAFLSFFSPSLRRAIQRDTAGAEVSVLDYDPLCQCQDNGRLKMRVISTQVRRSVATVDLLSGNQTVTGTKLRLILRRYKHEWKVSDVRTAEVPSLAVQLGVR